MNEQALETKKIPTIIQSRLDLYDSIKQDYIDLIPHYNIVLELSEAHPNNFFSIDISLETAAAYYKCSNLAEVVPLLRFLAKKGYTQEEKTLDNPYDRSRSWRCGKIRLVAFFNQEGATCKFVKIGEKPRSPEAIYELRCD